MGVLLLKGGISQMFDLIESCVLKNQAANRQNRLAVPDRLMVWADLIGSRNVLDACDL